MKKNKSQRALLEEELKKADTIIDCPHDVYKLIAELASILNYLDLCFDESYNVQKALKSSRASLLKLKDESDDLKKSLFHERCTALINRLSEIEGFIMEYNLTFDIGYDNLKKTIAEYKNQTTLHSKR